MLHSCGAAGGWRSYNYPDLDDGFYCCLFLFVVRDRPPSGGGEGDETLDCVYHVYLMCILFFYTRKPNLFAKGRFHSFRFAARLAQILVSYSGDFRCVRKSRAPPRTIACYRAGARGRRNQGTRLGPRAFWGLLGLSWDLTIGGGAPGNILR